MQSATRTSTCSKHSVECKTNQFQPDTMPSNTSTILRAEDNSPSNSKHHLQEITNISNSHSKRRLEKLGDTDVFVSPCKRQLTTTTLEGRGRMGSGSKEQGKLGKTEEYKQDNEMKTNRRKTKRETLKLQGLQGKGSKQKGRAKQMRHCVSAGDTEGENQQHIRDGRGEGKREGGQENHEQMQAVINITILVLKMARMVKVQSMPQKEWKGEEQMGGKGVCIQMKMREKMKITTREERMKTSAMLNVYS